MWAPIPFLPTGTCFVRLGISECQAASPAVGSEGWTHDKQNSAESGRKKQISLANYLKESLIFANAPPPGGGWVPWAFYTLPSSQREGAARTVPGTCSHFVLPLPLQRQPPFHWYCWSPGDELPVPSRIPGWNSSPSSPWRRSNTCLCRSPTAQGSMDMGSLKKNHTCLFPLRVMPSSLQTLFTKAFFQKIILPSHNYAIPGALLRLAKNQSLWRNLWRASIIQMEIGMRASLFLKIRDPRSSRTNEQISRAPLCSLTKFHRQMKYFQWRSFIYPW